MTRAVAVSLVYDVDDRLGAPDGVHQDLGLCPPRRRATMIVVMVNAIRGNHPPIWEV